MSPSERPREEEEPVVIRDRRKVFADGGSAGPAGAGSAANTAGSAADAAGSAGRAPSGPGPVGEVPSDADGTAPAAGGAGDPAVNTADAPSEAQTQLAERTADLQRLQADFANYRRRVERDREVLAQVAAGKVLEALLPVLDDLERAQQHGDLTGAFKSVADKLVGAVERFELTAFGEQGDVFDPAVHEAVTHDESPDVEVPTSTLIMRRGYKHGERLLRPAMVGVTAPSAPATAGTSDAESSQPTE